MVGFPLGAPVSPTPSNSIKFTLNLVNPRPNSGLRGSNLSCTIICVRNKVIIILAFSKFLKTPRTEMRFPQHSGELLT